MARVRANEVREWAGAWFADTAVRLLALLVVSNLCACAWRTGTTEHYFGPTLVRRICPPAGRADAQQTEQAGFAFEGGSQWGLSVGVVERVAIASIPFANSDGSRSVAACASPYGDGQWHLSWVHMRSDWAKPPEFIMRTVYGAQVAVGSEASAVRVGFARTTLLCPADDVLYAFEFLSDQPMQSRFEVWRPSEEQSMPSSIILKEGSL